MIKKFTDSAWDDYQYWLENDKKLLKRINRLIAEIDRDPCGGLGKPESLKWDFNGLWSRRIDSKHRIVYAVDNGEILFVSLRYHYEK